MPRRIRFAGGLALVSALCLMGGSSAVAHDEDCMASLWALPLEAVDLPDGWEVARWWPWYDGSPGHVSLRLAGPHEAFVTVELACVMGAYQYVDALLQAYDFNGDVEWLAVTAVGDRAWATRTVHDHEYSDGFSITSINWASGDIIGEVEEDTVIGEEAPFTDLEDIALAFDALLE